MTALAMRCPAPGCGVPVVAREGEAVWITEGNVVTGKVKARRELCCNLMCMASFLARLGNTGILEVER